MDANLNRLREGLRVLEDICRYILEDKKLSYELKNLRHLSRVENFELYLLHRDAQNDILKTSTESEQKRDSLYAIVVANAKRVQESARVLEEIFKLENIDYSENFKRIRYSAYTIEKELFNQYSKIFRYNHYQS